MLIGGLSRRMGRPKALIDVDGLPAALVVGQRLIDGGCRDVSWVAPAHAPVEILRLATVHDVGEGPVGAVLTALESSSDDWTFVIAVDHLGFDSTDVEHLIDSALRGRSDVDVFVATDGCRRQPLISIWRTHAARPLLKKTFESGHRSIDEVLESMSCVPIKFDPRALVNLNDPDELDDFMHRR